MKVVEVTPIKTVVEDSYEPGVSVKDFKDQFPTTPYLLKKFGVHEVPPGFFDVRYKDLNREDFPDLRDYQFEDVSLLANRAVGIIASEPRTGKTPTAISIFRAKEVRNFFIIAPASILLQWKSEIKKWYPGLEVVVYAGTPKKRAKLREEYKGGAVIMSYEMMRTDTEVLKNFKKMEGIIIDEGHKVKNHQSKVYSALSQFKKLKHRLWLSGTLAPNKPEECFTSLVFTVPSLFRGYWPFIEYYFRISKETNWANRKEFTVIGKLKNPVELPQYLDKVGVRRTQKEVMPWLPEVDVVPIPLDLTPTQKKYYESMVDTFEAVEGDVEVVTVGILDQLIRLRQICLEPALVGLKSSNPKLEWIKEYIKDYPEKQIIIFSNFTEYIKILHSELPGSEMIIGETSSHKRELLKNQFQEGKIKILIINIKAGKEGLTLDNGDVAIFTDVFPPAADIVQAENRITSTRPDRVKESTVYRLMMSDTYDERLYGLVDRNSDNTAVINDFRNYLSRRNQSGDRVEKSNVEE